MSGIDTGIDRNSTTIAPTKATKARQKAFLNEYAQHANVLVAARAAGIHRTTVYTWLEKCADFSFAYNLAKEDARDVLRAEIFRRGVEGWDEPVYQQGVLVGKVRKYDTSLLMYHSKMLCVEYRDASKLSIDANVSTTTTAQAGSLTLDLRNATSSELHRLKSIAQEMQARQQQQP